MGYDLKVGVLGATGMVGQRFVSLLETHPWFRVTVVAASAKSAGQGYRDAVAGRWALAGPVPERAGALTVRDASDVEAIAGEVDFVFCAVDMHEGRDARARGRVRPPRDAGSLEQLGAPRDARRADDGARGQPRARRAHRGAAATSRHEARLRRGEAELLDPELRPGHPPAARLRPDADLGRTYQAISGAGKTFASWPEMVDNVIPFIGGEEEKSEQEPMKIWGRVEDGRVVPATRAGHHARSASACRCPTGTWPR